MANETLSIQKDDARLTVIGKSKADIYINSGLGLDLGDLDIGSLDPFDLNWQTDVQDPDNLPDEIRIISPPYKTEYKSGEKVDLDGIIVKAYKNGSVWTDSAGKYTEGVIPIEELMVNPLVLNDLGWKNDNYPVYSGPFEFACVAHGEARAGYIDFSGKSIISANEDGLFVFCYPNGQWQDSNISIYFLSEVHTLITGQTMYPVDIYKPTSGGSVRDKSGYSRTDNFQEEGEYTKDGKTVRYTECWESARVGRNTTACYYAYFWETLGGTFSNVCTGYGQTAVKYEPFQNNTEKKNLFWNILFSSYHGAKITISWKRPVDGTVLANEFHVEAHVGRNGNEEQ